MVPAEKTPTIRLAAVVGLVLIGCLAGCAGEPRRRVFVLGLDGFDPDAAGLLASEGRLPNLDRLRQEGCYGRLRSQPPLLSPVVWTTIATGKTPDVHGIGDFVAVGPDGGRLPVTSDLRRVKAIWNIASEAHRRVTVVGWWATWPPEPVDGVVVSDHTAYHFLFPEGLAAGGTRDERTTYPPELAAEIAPELRRPGDLAAADLAPYVRVTAEDLARPFRFDDDLAHFRWALATAMSYRDVGLDLWRRERPDLEMVYIEATDSTAHLFGHLFRSQGLAGKLAAQQAKYGGAVEGIYRFADSVVGDVLAALDDDTALVVLSDHGFKLGVLPDDPSTTRDLRRVSERFHREEGVIYLYGAGVRRGVALEGPTILDVAPTLLALLGVPAAADMPGKVLAEALDDPPPARVASYEDGSRADGKGGPGRAPRDEAADAAQLAHLRSLGYLGGSGAHVTSQSDRIVAITHFRKGDYAEAARIFSRLVAAEPDDAALRSSLAGALGELGRLDEAKAQLERAIELQPLVPESYYNLAVIAERQGDSERAVTLYRTALRYAPDYTPARRALVRLTGNAEVDGPKSAAEREAARLAQQAASAARRGAYAEAMRLLDAAEASAPRYALVQQYRSNVAYLMGDRERAIAALEKGLAIEPDNALFRENLERLRAEAAAVTPRPAPAL